MQTAPLPLRVSATPLPIATAGVDYGAVLSAEGGTGDYTWGLRSGALPPGLAVYADGTISGLAMSAGNYNFTVWVADSGSPAQILDASYAIVVEQNSLGNVAVRVIQRSDRAVQVEYGIAGLAAQTQCRLTLSTDPGFSTTAATVTDSGGPALRRTFLGATVPLASAQLYFVKVACGNQFGTASFTTWPSVRTASATAYLTSVPLPGLGATSLRVDYGTSPALGSSITAPCGTSCTAQFQVPAQSLFFQKRTYLAGPQPVASSTSTPTSVR
jgi:hypothetical protein